MTRACCTMLHAFWSPIALARPYDQKRGDIRACTNPRKNCLRIRHKISFWSGACRPTCRCAVRLWPSLWISLPHQDRRLLQPSFHAGRSVTERSLSEQDLWQRQVMFRISINEPRGVSYRNAKVDHERLTKKASRGSSGVR